MKGLERTVLESPTDNTGRGWETFGKGNFPFYSLIFAKVTAGKFKAVRDDLKSGL